MTPVKLSALLAALALAIPAAPLALAGGEPDYAALLEQKAPSVVTVKFVLKMRMSMGGQTQDDEQNADARGVVVDPSGLVMLANDSFEGGMGMLRSMMRRRGGAGMDVSATPTDVKVMFGSDAKEHDAVVVARDTNLGLAFVQILAPEGTLAAVDLGKTVEPKVGQTVVGVTRKSRGFDSAAVFERAIVTGRIEKPRAMWALSGEATLGVPMYDADGKVVGVPVRQQGVEGADEGGGPMGGLGALLGGAGGNQGVFLLAHDAVTRALEQAKKRVPEAVEKAKASKEASKPAEGPDGAKPPETPTTPDAPKAPEQPK